MVSNILRKSKRLNKILLLCIIGGFISISGDLTTTYIGLSNGYYELNPVISFIWSNFGLIGFIIAKLTVVSYITLCYYLVKKQYSVHYGKIYCIFAFTIFIVYDSIATTNNIYTIFF